MKDLHALRRQYGALSLDEATMLPDPLQEFERWLAQAIETEVIDPTAMVLSTVDVTGQPDARVLLLKSVEKESFIFYTHYLSTKGKQLAVRPNCALTFYWPTLSRQVRVQGEAMVLEPALSDAYFASRPYLSQLSAVASIQSQRLVNKQALEERINQLKQKHVKGHVPRPLDWGGYRVNPSMIEFWQGRDHRLHDRVVYQRTSSGWEIYRLAP